MRSLNLRDAGGVAVMRAPLILADMRLEVFPFPSQGVPLHVVHRPFHKSGSGSTMGVGEGERPDMIAVQEGDGTRAS